MNQTAVLTVLFMVVLGKRQSHSHVAAGNESISRSRYQAAPTADDNVCNYVLRCSRRLTSEGSNAPIQKSEIT